MKLIDANVLLYAYGSQSPHHGVARRWLEQTLSSAAPVGLAWVTILAFLRIATNARLDGALSMPEAVAIVDEWLERPTVTILEPTERHWLLLGQVLDAGQVRGPLVTDAHLAALAIEHGATLCSTDRDFGRFPGLSLVNPLDEA